MPRVVRCENAGLILTVIWVRFVPLPFWYSNVLQSGDRKFLKLVLQLTIISLITQKWFNKMSQNAKKCPKQ